MEGLTVGDFLWEAPEDAVGLLLYTASGREILVGDINELGGVCDHCTDGSYAEVVTRYRRVWTPTGPIPIGSGPEE